MGEAVKKRVVSFSAKVKSNHVEKQPTVHDHLLQAVIVASQQDETFKANLLAALQDT